MIVALLAVLALIFVLRWLVKRVMPGGLSRSSRGIRVVARTHLSAKQQVLILQVGRRLLVVGDSGQNMTTLCEITDLDEAAALLGQVQGSESFAGAFRQSPEPSAPNITLPSAGDAEIVATRTELNGLAERVRGLAKHLGRA